MAIVIRNYARSRNKPEDFEPKAIAQMSTFYNKQSYFSSQVVINQGKVLPPHVFF